MAKKNYDENMFSFKSAFESEVQLNQYEHNALSIFALSLYLGLEDPQEFAALAITDGPNDKKVDVCYVDESENRAIIAQSYFSSTWGKPSAPSNKAGFLAAAIAWLLSATEEQIPKNLRTKAKELRKALTNGDIKRIEILYIHNCYESQNAQDELKVVADATRDITKSLTSNSDIPVVWRELGLNGIEELYKSRDSNILIEDWIDVPVLKYVEEQGGEWKAILATVPGDWIRRLRIDHEDRLFSANYRDYLGYIKRPGNINYEITQTADSEPINFWVYNNGITALTHELKTSQNVRIRGISIINGAQTTGALGDSSELAAAETKVLIRIVECRSKGLIDKIIRYNNTQNEIKPADRRSNDPIQSRLKADFRQYGITYLHRRSGRRSPRNAFTCAAIAPALCAFHGDPQTAYRKATEIFSNEDVYQKVFPINISSEHIFLVKSLSSAIDSVKTELKRKSGTNTATGTEEKQSSFLQYSSSKHFLFYIIGVIADEIMQKRVSNLFDWKCKQGVIAPENMSMTNAWDGVLHTLLPLIVNVIERQGEDPLYIVPRSAELTKQVGVELNALIASLKSVLGPQFDDIRSRTTI